MVVIGTHTSPYVICVFYIVQGSEKAALVGEHLGVHDQYFIQFFVVHVFLEIFLITVYILQAITQNHELLHRILKTSNVSKSG